MQKILVLASLSDRPYERPPIYVSHREMSHSTCAATRVFSAGSEMAYFFRKTNDFEEQLFLVCVEYVVKLDMSREQATNKQI